jgi:hypothetical protein
MTDRQTPLVIARAVVELSVLALPDPRDRSRYRTEYLAELHDLPATDQLRFTAGVLSQTFALRAALGSSPTRAEEDAMTLPTTQVPFSWRCRVLLWHRWVVRSTDDGGRYVVCARCRKERTGGPPSTNVGGFAAGAI